MNKKYTIGALFIMVAVMSFSSFTYAETVSPAGQLLVTYAAPEMVGNLSIPFYQANSVSLNWSVSSELYDGNAVYDIRYSTSLITESNFANATQFSGAVIPTDKLSMKSGVNRMEVVSGLSQNTKYFFALKSKFKDSDWSTLSSVPSLLIPTNTQNTGDLPTVDLSVGKKGAQVGLLQKFLSTQGFYTGPITNTFGPLTKAAVIQYQQKNNLPSTGYVGSMTRKAMSAGKISL